MKFNRYLPWNLVLRGLILGLGLVLTLPKAEANVYPTNIRLNGGTTNIVASPGDPITISYLLNEPASRTTVQIRSSSAVVFSMSFGEQTQGTVRGFNEVVWDGRGTNGQSLPGGSYSVAVVSESSGYTNWTQITSDTEDPNTYVYDGRGIAVDRNPTSPYYGRVFVANASLGTSPAPGDTLGILKFNADTSDAEEGISSADLDGHQWSGGDVSPWKLEVSADDYVYVDDLANGGEIFRWDPTVSSNSLIQVLRADNQPAGAALSGPAIVGTGSGSQIWMANTNLAEILKWSVTASLVCASNDTGSVVVTNTGTNFFDVALDNNGNIYTCAFVTLNDDPSPRVFRYHPNGTLPLTNSEWAVGVSNDTYAGASGIAVDPTGTYVAVAFQGPAGLFSTNGNTKVLWATNGAVAANLDLGVIMQGDPNHSDTDCAWDAVGNVYYIDNYFGRWRACSPPGTNQAVTLALATIQLSGGSQPPPSSTLQITRITVVGGNVNIDFSAGTNDTASEFSVVGSATVNGSYSKVSGAVITPLGPGLFRAVFAVGTSVQYFRIAQTGGPVSSVNPVFTKVEASGSNIVLSFQGAASDAETAFTILSSSVANGSYSPAANVTITKISPGLFQASLPRNGLVQFYKIRR